MDNHDEIRTLLDCGKYNAAMSLHSAESEAALRALVPEHLRDGLTRHILVGGYVGGFLTAFLENDLNGAVLRADDQSFAALRSLCQFMHGFSPLECRGSADRVKDWRSRGGICGHLGRASNELSI